MLVYRIEHPTHGGAFHGSVDAGITFRARCSLEESETSPWSMPSPHLDAHSSGPSYTGACRGLFAYHSVHELHRWWGPKHRETWHNYGFVISVYDVPEDTTTVLRTQVCFQRSTATLVETLNLATLEANREAA